MTWRWESTPSGHITLTSGGDRIRCAPEGDSCGRQLARALATEWVESAPDRRARRHGAAVAGTCRLDAPAVAALRALANCDASGVYTPEVIAIVDRHLGADESYPLRAREERRRLYAALDRGQAAGDAALVALCRTAIEGGPGASAARAQILAGGAS